MASAATPTFGFVGTTFVNRTPPHVSQPVLKQNACLFMDRGGSLREGAAKELPALNQSDCTAHVWGNVKKQAGYKKLKQTEKKELKKAFYEASNALMTSACDVALATIKSISSDIFAYLTTANTSKERWCTAYANSPCRLRFVWTMYENAGGSWERQVGALWPHTRHRWHWKQFLVAWAHDSHFLHGARPLVLTSSRTPALRELDLGRPGGTGTCVWANDRACGACAVRAGSLTTSAGAMANWYWSCQAPARKPGSYSVFGSMPHSSASKIWCQHGMPVSTRYPQQECCCTLLI
jgi:hypothetical protein